VKNRWVAGMLCRAEHQLYGTTCHRESGDARQGVRWPCHAVIRAGCGGRL